MPSRLHAALFALSLAACAGRDGGPAPITPNAPPEPVIADTSPGSQQTPPPIVPSPDPVGPIVGVTTPQTPPEAPAPTRFAPPPPEDSAGKAISQKSRSPGGHYTPPCDQSTVQLALTNDTGRESRIRVTGMRLLSATTKHSLGRITGRKPTQWDNNLGVYRPWDERVPARTTANISYRIGEVDRSGGGPPGSDDGTYILEVDVTIDGKRKTLRSPEFTREMQHIMVT